MKYIYFLQHCYEDEIEEGITIKETKTIGIYSTREKAEQTVKKFMKLPGFRNFPEDCFYIDKYLLDEDCWVTGFMPVVRGKEERI